MASIRGHLEIVNYLKKVIEQQDKDNLKFG
jgi:hypothetical protein